MLLPPTSNVYRVISENLQLKFYVDASDGENLHLSQWKPVVSCAVIALENV